jgi:hypothetical protein
MTKRGSRSTTVVLLIVATSSVAALAASAVLRRGAAEPASVTGAPQKKLRDIARERDIEVEGGIHPAYEHQTFEELARGAQAIVYGRMVDSKSFFDESGQPIEHGENITTEYTVEVYRVLKDRTLDAAREPGRAAPAPLATPLKLARDGGVVHVNGHRAAVKYKGYESLSPGKQYVFFLQWSPDYKAYLLSGGISGVVLVNDDLSLKPLASSKEIQSKLRGMDLENLIDQVN